MADYQFSVIVPTPPMTHEDILDAAIRSATPDVSTHQSVGMSTA